MNSNIGLIGINTFYKLENQGFEHVKTCVERWCDGYLKIDNNHVISGILGSWTLAELINLYRYSTTSYELIG